jgi:hypothetical protein
VTVDLGRLAEKASHLEDLLIQRDGVTIEDSVAKFEIETYGHRWFRLHEEQ